MAVQFDGFAALNSLMLIAILLVCIFILIKVNDMTKPISDMIDKLPEGAFENITKLADKFDKTICVEKDGVIFPGFDKLGLTIPKIKVC